MVFAPGHFQRVAQPRQRRRIERASVRVFALVALVVLGLATYSLTTHQGRSANGCIDFSYSTMIGGASMSKCGAAARELCLTRRTKSSIDGDFQTELYAACRKAGLRVGAA